MSAASETGRLLDEMRDAGGEHFVAKAASG